MARSETLVHEVAAQLSGTFFGDARQTEAQLHWVHAATCGRAGDELAVAVTERDPRMLRGSECPSPRGVGEAFLERSICALHLRVRSPVDGCGARVQI